MDAVGPRRNRVTPFGEITATPHRGTLMGNRGCLHDAQQRIVRTARTTAWISCLPTWPGVHRTLMAPGGYTELFFLDEATALAAGHRPCGTCRKARLEAFKQAWATARTIPRPVRVADIDTILAAERRCRHPAVDAALLPDGVIVALPGGADAWLRWRGTWRRWAFAGYGPPEPVPAHRVILLTPPAIVATIRAGYGPTVHESAVG
jgi:hypothetical protein